MNRVLYTAFAVVFMFGAEAQAGKPDTDKCTGCHGLDGRSNQPDMPNIAGQKKNYLIKALQDFRIGERRHLMMNFLARSMSDEEIEDYASYYAGFE